MTAKPARELIEDAFAGVVLVSMALLTFSEIVARNLFGSGVPASASIVHHLTLWVCFLGSALAAREGKLLSFASENFLPKGRLGTSARVLSATVGAGVAALFCRAGIELVLVEREAGTRVFGSFPAWVAQLVIPMAFALIAVRIVLRADSGRLGRAIVAAGLLAGALLSHYHGFLEEKPSLPGVLLVLLGTLLGGPIFAALGGIAALLFMKDGVGPVAVLVEAYRMAVSPTLPAIPLFTLVGFLLAEGNASKRLLRFFRAFFGWIPGGTALVCILLCAFFTIPTGGSGVTILALGALLLQALLKDHYPERFSLGLLTSSGSIGLLFAPSLPLILFGIVAQTVSIEDLFIAGFLPGLLLVGLLSAYGMRKGITAKVERPRFDLREARGALWEAKWEILLPVIGLGAIFGGFATLVEASAIVVVYTFLTQCFIHRDIAIGRELLTVLQNCIVMIGGVLLILAVAMGFSNYMVDAQVPARALEWVQGNISSPIVFLLILNLFLLVVGCIMDIFSATVVVVPLILPIGLAFDINPIHLGIIFVANLELGYLTPPVGLNLFFASYRFERPLLTMYRAAVPFLIILGIGVLLITYLPALSLGILRLMGRL